ncbi:ABC transporter, partial [Candidatus Falkowbacteria bacterium CG10_big_fil_rev_8_21_14_0_10_37_6]
VRQEVEDILAEYQSYANNKLAIEFIDPQDDEKIQQNLQLVGIPLLQFNVLENDKYEVINGYLGMVVQYGDNKQAIPVVNNTQNLEYQLTSAIKKVVAAENPVIGFTIGHGELDRAANLTILNQKLSEIYTVRDVDL